MLHIQCGKNNKTGWKIVIRIILINICLILTKNFEKLFLVIIKINSNEKVKVKIKRHIIFFKFF